MSVVAKGPGGPAAALRSAPIDGIRGVAALALMTVHVAMFSGLLGTKALDPPRPPSNFLGGLLVSGMPSFIGVFFVLPAFFLYRPLAKAIIAGTPRPPQGRSLIRRLLRLLPGYYAMCLIAIFTLNRGSIDGIWYVLRPLLLLQVYLPSPFVPKLMNGMEITWTVPSMVQWYLALPLIAWAVHRFAARGATPLARARRLMLPVPVLIAVGVGWLFLVKANHWDNRIVFWWPQGFAPTIGIGMGLAIMIALAQVSPADTPRILRAAANRPRLFWLGAGAVYLVNCVRPFSVIGMDAIYSVAGLLTTYVMVALFGLLASLPLIAPGAKPTALNAVLGSRPLAYLGRISYGIYLWHFAVMHFYFQPGAILSGQARPIREFYGTTGFVKLELITFTGAVLFASLSYFLLERPLLAWVEARLGYAGRGAPTPAAALPGPRPADGRAGGRALVVPPGDETGAAVAAAVAVRDAIQANLVDLERSAGRRLLTGAELTGETRRRWDRAAADLAALWDVFTAYSAVVDDAVSAFAGGRAGVTDRARVEHDLVGPAVLVAGAPAPLAERHITDDGRIRLTVEAAIERMNDLFHETAGFLCTVERIWHESANRLDAIERDLERARRQADEREDEELAGACAAAEITLRRLRSTVATDPLLLHRDGRVDGGLDELHRTVSTLVRGGTDGDAADGAGEPDLADLPAT